jgi:hypothetical protein
VAALVALSQPVYAGLERDPATKRMIERIRAISGDRSPQAVTCEPGGAPRSNGVSTQPWGDQRVLDGTYRNRKTVRDYTAAGVNETEAIENSGVHTIKLDRGRLWDNMTTPEKPAGAPCEGSYELSGDTITFAWDPDGECHGDFTATWRLTDGELHFTNIRTRERLDEIYWGVRPFRKIG